MLSIIICFPPELPVDEDEVTVFTPGIEKEDVAEAGIMTTCGEF
jgi:hypothetical protein